MKKDNSLVSCFCVCGIDWDQLNKSKVRLRLAFNDTKLENFIEVFKSLIILSSKSSSILNEFDLNHIAPLTYTCNDYYPRENFEILDVASVSRFCFPSSTASLRYTKPPHSTNHSFMMTNQTGIRFYGSCVRFFDEIEEEYRSILEDVSLFDILKLDVATCSERDNFFMHIKKNKKDCIPYYNYVIRVSSYLLESSGSSPEAVDTSLSISNIFNFTEVLSIGSILNSKITSVFSLYKAFVTCWDQLVSIVQGYIKSRLDHRPMFEEKSICLVSTYEHFNTFSLVLTEIVDLLHLNEELPLPLERVISHITAEVPVPPPGKLMIVFKLFAEAEVSFSCTRPPLNKLPLHELPLRPLFECLSCQNLLMVFSALLIEKKVIVSSGCLYKLSCVMFGLAKLLFPLLLETPFVPILPESMLELVQSPFPVFLGVHSGLVPNDQFLDANIVFLDVDENRLEISFGNEIPQPPPEALGKLVRNLKRKVYGESLRALSTQEGNFKHFGSLCAAEDKEFNEKVREVFLLYMVDVLKDYKQCITTISIKEIDFFDRDRFVKGHKETGIASEYLMLMTSTQMFQMFCEEGILLPERTFQVMFFDSWIDRETKREGYKYNAYFLEDSSQDIVAEYTVSAPNAEDYESKSYTHKFPRTLNLENIPQPIPNQTLYKLRRGSHLLKNIKKVSLVLESVYLSYYTKKTVYGAKFKLIMKQITSSCTELENVVQFVVHLSSSFDIFLGRIKHNNAEIFKDDDTGKLSDRDLRMHQDIWPSFLRAEKAWVALLEGYSYALRNKILGPLQEMLRKLTNSKVMLKANTTNWFSKIERTKTIVEDLKILTEKSEKSVEFSKKEVQEANMHHVTPRMFNGCTLRDYTKPSIVKQAQRRMVRSIVDAERNRLSFAEKVASLNRELRKFSEGLSDMFLDCTQSEQLRKKNLQNLLIMVAELSYDFFFNLQKAVKDSIGNSTKSYIAKNDVEVGKSETENYIEFSILKGDYEQKLLLREKDANNVTIEFSPTTVNTSRFEVYLPYLQNDCCIQARANISYLKKFTSIEDLLLKAEVVFEEWRVQTKQVRKIYKVIIERAEIRAQAYASLASTLLQFVPSAGDEQDTRGSLLPNFIRRYSSSGHSPTSEERRTQSMTIKILKKLQVTFGEFGKLLIAVAVPAVEDDVIYFSKETNALLKEVTRSHLNTKNSMRRRLQFASRTLDKAVGNAKRETQNYNEILDEYTEAYLEKHGFSQLLDQEVKFIMQKMILDIEIKNSVESEFAILDKKLTKLHLKASSQAKEMESARLLYLAADLELQEAERSFLKTTNISLRILQFHESIRVFCTVNALSSYQTLFNTMFENLCSFFESDIKSIKTFNFEGEFLAANHLNEKLEDFSRAIFSSYYRGTNQEEVLFLDGESNEQDKNMSFTDSSAISDFSSGGDEGGLSFATSMTTSFPVIIVYFGEFATILKGFQVCLENCLHSLCKVLNNLNILKERLSQKWSLTSRVCSLGMWYSNIVGQAEYEIQELEEQIERVRDVCTKVWFLHNQMTKVVAVHAKRKDILQDTLARAKHKIEIKNSAFLNSQRRLEDFERSSDSFSWNTTTTNFCLHNKFVKKNILFQLRDRKELDYRALCNAQRALALQKGTHDDCIAQMLHRLESNLAKYFKEFVEIIKTHAQTCSKQDNTWYSNTTLEDNHSGGVVDDTDLFRGPLEAASMDHKELTKRLETQRKYLIEQVQACKLLTGFMKHWTHDFSKLRKSIHTNIDKFMNKCTTLGFMTNDSSSAARSLDTVNKWYKDKFSDKERFTKQFSIKVINSLHMLKEKATFLENQIQTNSGKILKNFKVSLEKYRKAKKNPKVKDILLQRIQQNLLDAEVQVKSELRIIAMRIHNFSQIKRMEVGKLFEVCAAMSKSSSEKAEHDRLVVTQSIEDINVVQDIQLFMEWYGKPLSSANYI